MKPLIRLAALGATARLATSAGPASADSRAWLNEAS